MAILISRAVEDILDWRNCHGKQCILEKIRKIRKCKGLP